MISQRTIFVDGNLVSNKIGKDSNEGSSSPCRFCVGPSQADRCGKLLRWDVVKWAVTVNIALAAAAAAFKQTSAGSQLVCLAEIVAGVGWLLMLYYNWRLTKTREDAEKTAKYLTSQGVDFAVIRGRERKKVTFSYDWQELLIFTVILFGSILPVALVSKLATATN